MQFDHTNVYEEMTPTHTKREYLHPIRLGCCCSHRIQAAGVIVIIPLATEVEWLTAFEALPHWTPTHPEILVVSPVSDAETLSVGGIIAANRAAGKKVVVVAITDRQLGDSRHRIDLALGRRRL